MQKKIRENGFIDMDNVAESFSNKVPLQGSPSSWPTRLEPERAHFSEHNDAVEQFKIKYRFIQFLRGRNEHICAKR